MKRQQVYPMLVVLVVFCSLVVGSGAEIGGGSDEAEALKKGNWMESYKQVFHTFDPVEPYKAKGQLVLEPKQTLELLRHLNETILLAEDQETRKEVIALLKVVTQAGRSWCLQKGDGNDHLSGDYSHKDNVKKYLSHYRAKRAETCKELLYERLTELENSLNKWERQNLDLLANLLQDYELTANQRPASSIGLHAKIALAYMNAKTDFDIRTALVFSNDEPLTKFRSLFDTTIRSLCNRVNVKLAALLSVYERSFIEAPPAQSLADADGTMMWMEQGKFCRRLVEASGAISKSAWFQFSRRPSYFNLKESLQSGLDYAFIDN